jgi:hypothetical protein
MAPDGGDGLLSVLTQHGQPMMLQHNRYNLGLGAWLLQLVQHQDPSCTSCVVELQLDPNLARPYLATS